jgi:hypothetical protein
VDTAAVVMRGLSSAEAAERLATDGRAAVAVIPGGPAHRPPLIIT